MDDRVECRLCGRRFHSIGHHLHRAHDLSADEYRDRFGIRRGEPLTSPSTNARLAARLRDTIASGALDEHFAGNADRAADAGHAAAVTKAGLRSAGVVLPHGSPPTPRVVIEAIVIAIEGGAKVATAVKRSPITYSTFHAGLGRHPELKARVAAAKRR